MNEYWSLLVVLAFAIVLYVGTILWTESFFPNLEKKRERRILEISEVLHQALAAQIAELMQMYTPEQSNLFDKPEDDESPRKRLPAFARR
jgi:hypothetical protein